MEAASVELSANTAGKLSDCIARIGDREFWAALHSLIASVVAHETGAVFVYAGEAAPVRLFDSEGSAARNEVHKVLVSIGYLVSPYYNGLIRTDAAPGFYHIDEVAPDAFRESEYFEVYYGRKDVEDEGMFLCRPEADVAVVVMTERHRNRDRFTVEDLERLRALFPVIGALVERNLRLTGIEQTLAPEATASGTGYREIAERFGRDILSARERDVAMLILRGHSSKSAARLLEISPETERVHRRRLYAKLGIGSHSELFWMFLQASDYFDGTDAEDPLVSYLRDKRPELLVRG
jgi:DNA-binding CsgD family transcriptional regulator